MLAWTHQAGSSLRVGRMYAAGCHRAEEPPNGLFLSWKRGGEAVFRASDAVRFCCSLKPWLCVWVRRSLVSEILDSRGDVTKVILLLLEPLFVRRSRYRDAVLRVSVLSYCCPRRVLSGIGVLAITPCNGFVLGERDGTVARTSTHARTHTQTHTHTHQQGNQTFR